MNDEKLHAALRAGDEQAINEVIDQYSRLLWRVAWSALDRIGSTQDVEECVADTFVLLWEHPEKFDPQRGKLKTWLAVVARSRALDRCREILRRGEVGMETVILSTAGPEAAVQSAETRIALRSAIRAMEEPAREILIRRYYYQQKPGKIAQVLGMDVKQVKNSLYRSRQKLRALIEQETGGSYEAFEK